jgi:lysyl-tRNA synthetase, class II
MHTTRHAMAPTLEGADARVKELLRPAADPSATLGNAAPRQAGPKYHVIRLDHHRLGPRVYVLGLRIHEWHLGAVLVGGTLTGLVAEVWEPSPLVGVIGGLGLWLVLKDWRDLVPSRRDSAAWRIGLHRRTTPLRSIRRSEGLPALAAAVAFAVGLVNLASALTPNIAWRHHVLLQLEPVEVVPVFHTLAVPLSVALVVVAFYLRARRHRAWQLALVLLVVLGAVALLKGLDFEEAALSWAVAGLLWRGRAAFYVGHRPLGRPSPLLLVFGVAAVGSASLLAWHTATLELQDELAWGPLGVSAVGALALAVVTYVLFRPLGPAREPPCSEERRAASDLVRAHGHDTLAFFKLRQDAHYRFAAGEIAFLGYRVANRVLLIAGDPVGERSAFPGLLRDTCAFAETRGLQVAAIGTSRRLLPVYRRAGLRPLYLGDEAIVDTRAFSLEGRRIRKVRQSVSRAQAAGYSAELLDHERLDRSTLEELESVSARWRCGAVERGFSMAMDSLRGPHHAGSVVVTARDPEGRIRAFIHLVPTYGRPAMSLSFMRRDRDTPNGLMEFAVVRAIELLRDRGVEEVSLNFAAFARWIADPCGPVERVLGRVVSLANPFFQIESLHRFNAKFSPRWEPRYLLYEQRRSLPRVALAALRIEGQLPKLRS